MKKNLCLALVLCLCLSLFCIPSIAEGEREVVNFWYLWSGVEAEGMEKIVAKYNESQDKYQVVGLSVPDEAKIVVAIGSNEGPDITDSFSSAISSYYEQGILHSLNEYIDASGYDTSVFPEAMMETCTRDGNVVGLPINVMNYMMYYNVDIFEEAGLELPTTADELLDVASKLTTLADDGTIDQLGMPVFPYGYYLDAMVYGLGGTYTEDGETLNVDNEGFRKAVQTLKDYYDAFGYDNINTFQSAGAWLDATDPFLNGKQALRFDGSWLASFIKQFAPDLNYACMPIPTMNEGDTSVAVLSSSVFYVPATAKCPAGAFDFMTFLVGPEGCKDWLINCTNVPAHSGLYSDEDMLAVPDFAAYFDALQNGDTAALPTFANWNECLSLITDTVEQVVVGNISVDECVETIMSEYENLY